jgi:hypothetical protein
MSEYTLLDYVQTILSSMDSEEVNSITDTTESLQVANIVKTVFNDLQSRLDLPEHYTLFELNASGDDTQPVLMTRPSDVMTIIWVQYDKVLDGDTDPVYQKLTFLPLDEFLRMQDALLVSDTEVASFDYTPTGTTDSITFIYRNDKAPDYYTTFDDLTLIFDSYDSDVDTTLQKTKTRCYGRKEKEFTMSNSYVPFLDRDASTLLLNEAKVLAFAELKQVDNPVARQWANRGWVKSQKNKRGINNLRNELDRAPNYGRR